MDSNLVDCDSTLQKEPLPELSDEQRVPTHHLLRSRALSHSTYHSLQLECQSDYRCIRIPQHILISHKRIHTTTITMNLKIAALALALFAADSSASFAKDVMVQRKLAEEM